MIYVFFHKNCMDGAGARYAAWEKFGDQAIYEEVQYGEPFPDHPYQLADEIYIIDFSYSREVLTQAAAWCKVVVIDHHESAQKALDGLDFAIFDMNKSGAVLAWEYFHPEKPVPYFLLILQDYDLWNWKLSETLAVSTWFGTDINRLHPLHMQKLVLSCENYYEREYLGKDQLNSIAFDDYLVQGKIATAGVTKDMKDLIEKKKYSIRKFQGMNVAVFNTTTHISMLGHTACDIESVDYSMSYFLLRDGDIVLSFRAKKDVPINVSVIAEGFGGGGHRSSAGAVIKFPESLSFMKMLFESEVVG